MLMLPFLFSNFIQKWYFPQGIDWGASRIVIEDSDRDGNYEFIFSTYGGSYTIYFYELHLPDVWEIDSVSDLDQPLLWDIGDFDLDGFYDLVMQSSWGPPSVGIAIYETDLDVFSISWNSDRNRTDSMQTMVCTLLTIAGFSVLYRIVW